LTNSCAAQSQTLHPAKNNFGGKPLQHDREHCQVVEEASQQLFGNAFTLFSNQQSI
jgi:hypothetical protein